MREIRTSGLRRGKEVGGHWPERLSSRAFLPYSTKIRPSFPGIKAPAPPAAWASRGGNPSVLARGLYRPWRCRRARPSSPPRIKTRTHPPVASKARLAGPRCGATSPSPPCRSSSMCGSAAAIPRAARDRPALTPDFCASALANLLQIVGLGLPAISGSPEGCGILAPGETRGTHSRTESTQEGWRNAAIVITVSGTLSGCIAFLFHVTPGFTRG